MDLKSGYFIGNLILGTCFVFICITRPYLRKKMVIAGGLLLPFALTAPFYIPEYWNPPYLFGYIPIFKVGVEDFLFCFNVGGITSILYEYATGKNISKISEKSHGIIWTPYIFAASILLLGEFVFPTRSIITLIFTGFLIAVLIVIRRKDLFVTSFASGTLFTILYFIFFTIFNLVFPQYVKLVYHYINLSGIYLLGIPIEELLFAFSAGAGWSTIYTYMFGYSTK